MAQYEYKTVNTETIEGIELAEQLKAEGWVIIETRFTCVIMERKK